MTRLPPPSPPPGHQGHVLEHRGDRGQLGPREVQRAVVDDVEDDEPVGPQDPVDVEERLARGQVPRHRDPAERVADVDVRLSVPSRWTAVRPSATSTWSRGSFGRASRVRSTSTTPGSISTTRFVLSGRVARRYRGRVIPPPPTCSTESGPAGRVSSGGGEGLHVGELEVGRVARVDVAVPERVEHQRPALRTGGVGDDRRAVVPRLDLARRGHDERAQPGDQREHEWRGHADVRGDPAPPVGHDEREPADDEEAAGSDEDHAGRHVAPRGRTR